jgi:hypothetical protein
MSFSNGGHLLACVDKDHLIMFNCYNGEHIHSIKLRIKEDTEIKKILFARDDKALAVIGNNGFLGRW